MSAVAKEPSKTPAQARKWVAGEEYVCNLSKSPGYRLGRKYKCYKNDAGILCLRGEDGFEDICSMLVSGFKRA